MPVSSVSAQNSWGVYLLASFSLLAIMSSQMSGVAQTSREGADLRCADGVQSIVDSLHPGITVELSIDAWPGADPVHLEGRTISVDYGQGSIALPVVWPLSNSTISPSLSYLVWLAGGVVQVKPLG